MEEEFFELCWCICTDEQQIRPLFPLSIVTISIVTIKKRCFLSCFESPFGTTQKLADTSSLEGNYVWFWKSLRGGVSSSMIDNTTPKGEMQKDVLFKDL